VFPVAASAREDRHASLILDANTGAVLHDDEGDALRHPASLTKMMTLYLTFETLETGRLKMSDKISISEAAASVAPSKLELEPGDEIAVSDAIRALITKSANDIAVALSERIGGTEANFVRLMNARARDIGMAKTHFENASGLPNDDQVTTAHDMATLALHLQDDYPAYYPLFATREFTYQGKTYRNHNTMLNNFAGIDGIKTGYTRASGFNLVTSVRRSGRHLVGVVFGGDSAASRNGEMRVLLTRMLTRASAVDTRKKAPMLLAKLKAEPKRAQRRGAKRKPATDVADADQARAREIKVASAAPQPFAQATPPAPNVPPTQAAPVQVADADAVLREMAKSEPTSPVAEAPEAPVQIFKVRANPIVPKAARPTPSPDQTTDMEDTDAGSDAKPVVGHGTASRTDLGHFAEPGDAVQPTLAGKLGETFALANLAGSGPETQVAKTATGTRPPSPLDEKIAMLGASDVVPPAARAPEPVVEPIAPAPPAEQPAAAETPSPGPTAASAATPPTRLKAKVAQARAHAQPAVRPEARGMAPSTLSAQARTLKGPAQQVALMTSPARQGAGGRYEVQIGAYGSVAEAQRALSNVQGRAGPLLNGFASVTHPTMNGGRQMFRARFTGFDAGRAASTCTELRRQAVDCFVMAGE
jgi:D-alanyl-D-alanine carboxypeptidase